MSGKISFQEEKIKEIYLSLGSNQGNRKQNLTKAIDLLSEVFGPVEKISSIYETEAWGKKDQASFLNMVACFSTRNSPKEVLEAVLEIENKLGRVRKEKWGERNIDIDILFYNDLIYNDLDLKIPHPELEKRRFVLEPLKEIAPEFVHPVIKISVQHLSKVCRDTSKVEVYTS